MRARYFVRDDSYVFAVSILDIPAFMPSVAGITKRFWLQATDSCGGGEEFRVGVPNDVK